MILKQLSVFLENRAGRLAEVTAALGAAEVNIRALSIADATEFGLLRLLVDQTDEAIRALREAGITVSLTDVLAVEVADRPGGLGEVLGHVQKAGINVEYMYAFLEGRDNCAVLVFRFRDCESAARILKEAGARVLTSEDVSQL